MVENRYSQISIPTELVNNIKSVTKESGLGYRNVTEFVIESIRRRISDLQKEKEITKNSQEEKQ